MAKLRKLGPEAAKWIMELRGKGLSNTEIAREIERKYGIKVHRTNVGRFIKQHFAWSLSYARGKQEVIQHAEELLKTTKRDYEKIRKMLWKTVEEARSVHDYEGVRRALMSLSSHIARMNDILGEIKKTEVEKIDVTRLSTRISSILETLEKQGYIVIRKKIPKEFAS